MDRHQQINSSPTPQVFFKPGQGGVNPSNPIFERFGFFTFGNLAGVTSIVFGTNFTPTNLLNKIGLFTFGNLAGITSASLTMTTSGAGFDIEGTTELTSIIWPNLVSVDPTGLQDGYITISGNSHLTTLTFSALVTTNLNTDFTISGNPLLTLISLPAYVPQAGQMLVFTNNKLTAACVNAILARCVASAGFTGGAVKLNGGTSAAPTGQGITDKATLITRGVTVLTN